METLTVSLVLLLLAGASGVIVRFVRFLPLPLVQIALGAGLALLHTGLRIEFSPEVFLLLFIPPLLFADGWRVPKRELFRLRAPVLTLAIGLVVFTITGVGYFVHWAIPGVPLSAACVLAAVLSPTDAVAVSALSGHVKIPQRLMHILEGEALLNDASGLVAMSFAVEATLSGQFSPLKAGGTFLLVACGGLATGVALAWLFGRLRDKLVRLHGEQPASQIVLFILLLPFAAYLAAEHLHCSGILAAVAAGMTINYTDLSRGDHIATRLQNRTIWNILGFILNGIIFLLLGYQLPGIYGGRAKQAAFDSIPGGNWELGYYAAGIMAALIILRFVWIAVAANIRAVLRHWRGKKDSQRPSLRVMAAGALAGIRGAITLAAALTVPLTLPNGKPFPARDMIIFQATTVILLSLLVGCIGLPLLLRGATFVEDNDNTREEREARTLAYEAGMRALEKAQEEHEAAHREDQPEGDVYRQVSERVRDYYQLHLDASREPDTSQASRAETIAGELRLIGARAERDKLYELRRENRINDETMRELVREIDLFEVSLAHRHGNKP